MSKLLRVLIIEDSEDDTLFVVRELQRGGFEPFYQRVDTLPALSSALDHGEWDVIICDHTLPGFGSLQALERVKHTGLDIPFIVVSGTIGEDTAVKVMKDGASDYVMKKHLFRLPPAIGRELGEARCRRIRHQAEAALLRSERELNDFFEFAPIGLCWLDPNGTILRVNHAELEMLGYPLDEFVGHSFSEFCLNGSVADDILRRLHGGESLKDFEVRLRCKNGTVKDAHMDANVLREDGRFIHARCFTRDITSRKRGEEASAYLAAIVDSSDDAVIGTTLEGIIRSWNNGAERMYGYAATEVIGRPISLLVPPFRPDNPPPLRAPVKDGEYVRHYETIRLRKNGTHIPVSLTFSPIKDRNGTVVGTSTVERDMTERKREEEERLKLIADLTEALANIRTLRGLLPICAECKRIRDDQGYWEQLESFVSHHTQAEFTHSICPDCRARSHPELARQSS